ncbi:MAG: EamA family transporter [Rhodobiaceae bacterium]|nr:EamA family transporter [Rhodobiaceae bacterium]
MLTHVPTNPNPVPPMSLFGLLLVLAAAFCHAGWNFFVKRINAGPELVWLFSIISVALYLPLAVAVFVRHPHALDGEAGLFVAGSMALHLGYFLLLQQGYRAGDLSLIYPVARATGPLVTLVLAVTILGEAVSPTVAAGALAIIAGVAGLTGKAGGSADRPLASLGFGITAGLLIGSYTVWDAHTVTQLAVPPLLLDYASSAGRSVLLAPVALRRRAKVRSLWTEHRGAVLAIAVLNPLAYILVLTALAFAPVVYVAPLRETSVLITVALGSIVLGEGQLRRRLGWAALILAGAATLAAA